MRDNIIDKIIIDLKVNNKIYFFNIEKIIRNSLKYCSPEHLMGLGRIVVVEKFSGKKRNWGGYYQEKRGVKPAEIFIAFGSLYVSMPSIFFALPWMAKFRLIHTLYHEIGHHCHYTLRHGVKKLNMEKYANKYARDTKIKAYKKWLPLIILMVPFFYILGALVYVINRCRKNISEDEARND